MKDTGGCGGAIAPCQGEDLTEVTPPMQCWKGRLRDDSWGLTWKLEK